MADPEHPSSGTAQGGGGGAIPPVRETSGPGEPALIAWMRHEIRTPVNALVGLANLLADTDLSPAQRDYVASLRESAEMLSRLVDRVLDLARLAVGQLVLDARAVRLVDLVEAAFDDAAPRAAARGLDLLCDLDDRLPSSVVGDEARLRQLVAILLEQAIQRTHAGQVRLAVSGEVAGSVVGLRVEVHDTGIELSEPERSRLLGPLVELVGSGARGGGSQELAFALARGLVERLGGRLELRVEPTEGTTVRAELPLPLFEGEPSRERVEGWRPDLAGRALLVIDDNAAERALIARYGRRLGFDVHEAATSAEALALLDRGVAVDVALLDDRLPEDERAALMAGLARAAPAVRLIAIGEPAPRAQMERAVDRLVQPVTPSRLARVLLPRAVAPARSPSRSPLRILIGEDDPASRKVLLGVLDRLGYRADVACDGRDVLARLAATPYDVLLLDMHMPEVDGEGVVRRLVAEMPAARRPHIIAISATDAAEDRARWLAVGVDDWVSKTLPLADLHAALARAVGRAAPAAVPEALSQLEASGAPDLAREVARVFLEDADASLEALDAALAQADEVALEQAAHRLKGSAAMVGAEAVARGCARLMAAARRGALEEVRAALAEVRTALAALRPAFEQYAARPGRLEDHEVR
jgi:CheY-like chemotaxis protein/HPt (histidine-containing phosphotransfer) domain-containing protein